MLLTALPFEFCSPGTRWTSLPKVEFAVRMSFVAHLPYGAMGPFIFVPSVILYLELCLLLQRAHVTRYRFHKETR